MSFENLQPLTGEKYYSGFNPEWLTNPEIKAEADKIATFYEKQFANLELEANSDEEILIHFSNNDNIFDIESDNSIKNNSIFYDGGREKLSNLGFDFDRFDKAFGNNKSVVSIPLNVFKQWTGTLAWLKLTVSGALDNAVVFTTPKKDIILRDGRYIDKAFQLVVNGSSNQKDLDRAKLDYFESTSTYSEGLFKDKEAVWEAWIPHQVSLEDNQIINYTEQ